MESNNINKMAIKQKLIIDKSKTNNYQIIVRDETGLYTSSNLEGYGGNNGNGLELFSRYIFDIINLNTGQGYRQIQSNNIDNIDEYYNPSLERIFNKEDITLDSDNQDLEMFSDGVYKITMNLEFINNYQGEGFLNSETIVNVPGASLLKDNYNAIIANNSEIYDIISVEESTVILDRPITNTFTSFKAILKTSKTVILKDGLTDCLNKKIADSLTNCDCDNTKSLNSIAELQLLEWGINRCIDKEDFLQAKEYIDLQYKICKSFNCGC